MHGAGRLRQPVYQRHPDEIAATTWAAHRRPQPYPSASRPGAVVFDAEGAGTADDHAEVAKPHQAPSYLTTHVVRSRRVLVEKQYAEAAALVEE
jgi:hypothetical protein